MTEILSGFACCWFSGHEAKRIAHKHSAMFPPWRDAGRFTGQAYKWGWCIPGVCEVVVCLVAFRERIHLSAWEGDLSQAKLLRNDSTLSVVSVLFSDFVLLLQNHQKSHLNLILALPCQQIKCTCVRRQCINTYIMKVDSCLELTIFKLLLICQFTSKDSWARDIHLCHLYKSPKLHSTLWFGVCFRFWFDWFGWLVCNSFWTICFVPLSPLT